MNIFIIVQPFAAVCFAFRPSFSHYFCLFLIWFSCLTTLIVILPFSSYCYLYPSYFIHLSHLLAPSPWTVQYCHVLALTDTITLLFSWNLMLNASRLSPIYNSVDWPLFPTTRGFIYQLIQSVRCTSVVRTRVNVSDQIDRGTYIRDGLLLKIKILHIYLYFIATEYWWNNALVEYIDNWTQSYSQIIIYRNHQKIIFNGWVINDV